MSGETDTTVTCELEVGKAERNFASMRLAALSKWSRAICRGALFDLSKPDERFSAVALGDERETVAGERDRLFE